MNIHSTNSTLSNPDSFSHIFFNLTLPLYDQSSLAETNKTTINHEHHLFMHALVYYSAYFSIYVVVALLVLISLRFQLDKPAIVMILAYFSYFMIRLSSSIVNYMTGMQSLMSYFMLPNMVANLIIDIVIYHYAFQMKLIQDKLESQSYQEFKKREKMTNSFRILIFSLYCLTFTGIFIVNAEKYISSDQADRLFTDKEWLILIISRCVKFLAIDLPIGIFLLRLLLFFVKKKKEALIHSQKSFSCYNYCVIAWIIFLILIQMTNYLLSLIFGNMISVTQFSKDPILEEIYEILRFIVIPFANFLDALTFLYMYQIQGKLAKQKLQQLNKIRNRYSLIKNGN